jgi:probable HAF family extracellular repeat protein
MKRLLLLAAIFVLSTGWTIRVLPTLPGGGLCVAQALNVTGEAVGFAFNSAGRQRAVFWNKAGAITEIPTSAISGRFYTAYDVNDLGWVVGKMGTSTSAAHAFKWRIGSPVTDLGGSSAESIAFGISEQNHVVGQWTASGTPPPKYAVVWPSGSTTVSWLGGFGGNVDLASDVAANAPVAVGTSMRSTTGHRHAFLYIDGRPLRDLGTLGGDNSFGRAVSVGTWPDPSESTIYAVGDSETVPGSFYTTDAFLYHAGTMTNIGGLPGCTQNYAYGVNRAGDVVGYSWCSGYSRAFLYRGGVMIDLNTLIGPGTGWEQLQMAHDINERGQIAGYGIYLGQGRGFIMTP